MYRPTEAEQLAIKARLNFILGAEEFDRLFLGFECGEIVDQIAHVYTPTEYYAARIDSGYQLHIAVAIESVIKKPIKAVNVFPKNLSDKPL